MRLLKYHGLGNDFLLLLDFDGGRPIDASTARALCDRRRGVGADGLIRIFGERTAPAMELHNADGSPAEISGNGLRCVVRALSDEGLMVGTNVVVETAKGPRSAQVLEGGDITVDLTPARMPEVTEVDGAARIALDNPHVVVRVDAPALADLCALAAPWGPVNVEVVAPGPGSDELTMRVWERGVGETESCGSGSCAAALAGRQWGLVGDRVVVHQPGGDLIVDLVGERILLTGPATFVASIDTAVAALGDALPWR